MNTRITTLVFGAVSTAALLFQLAGCDQGGEGDRCNPDLSGGSYGTTSAQGDCNGGFVCFQPSLCAENYCCPPPTEDGGASPSSNPNCQTGCNGGAASICYASQEDDAACGFACANQESDLVSLFETYAPAALDDGIPPMCVAPASDDAGAPPDAGTMDAAPDGGQDAGILDGATDGAG